MPRGVYDRKKSKTKQAQQLPGAPTTKLGKSSTSPVMELTEETTRAGNTESPVEPLYRHLTTLVTSRGNILASQHEMNPTLVQVVDQEIIATYGALRSWREKTFPVEVEKKAAPQAAQATTPSGVFAPAPQAQATTAPAPLPFTPAAVESAIKAPQQVPQQ